MRHAPFVNLLVVSLFFCGLVLPAKHLGGIPSKQMETRNSPICPRGNFEYMNRCWLSGRAAGPMRYNEANTYCKERGMRLPDLSTDLNEKESGIDWGDDDPTVRALFSNPVMNYFLNGFVFYNVSRDADFAFVRCVSSIAESRPQEIFETICPPGTIPGGRVCWEAKPPVTLIHLAIVTDLSEQKTWQKASIACKARKGRLPSLEDWRSISRHKRIFDRNKDEWEEYRKTHGDAAIEGSPDTDFKYQSNISQMGDGSDIVASFSHMSHFWTADPAIVIKISSSRFPIMMSRTTEPGQNFFTCVHNPVRAGGMK